MIKNEYVKIYPKIIEPFKTNQNFQEIKIRIINDNLPYSQKLISNKSIRFTEQLKFLILQKIEQFAFLKALKGFAS